MFVSIVKIQSSIETSPFIFLNIGVLESSLKVLGIDENELVFV